MALVSFKGLTALAAVEIRGRKIHPSPFLVESTSDERTDEGPIEPAWKKGPAKKRSN
jgi:hypothetical protein